MKFIHTADWHIGKIFKGVSMIDDQEFIFKEFIKLIDDEQPEAIIVSGDIYDRVVPHTDAVNLLDEVIFEIVSRKIPMLCISGNHDSADRLNFASRLLARSKFFIETKPNKNSATIILEDNFGEIYFSLIPYFEVPAFREEFNCEEKIDNNIMTKMYISELRKKIPANKRSVAVAHLFATGGTPSDSERKFVGAVENVDAANFSDYNYTALGHLHKPQTMAKSHGYVVRYSGSPLKYSFDEMYHKKGVTIVEIDGEGNTKFRQVDLKPRRDVRVVRGTIKELMNYPKTENYIHADLTDEKYILYAMAKLRESAFPNILSLEFVNLIRNPGDVSEYPKPNDGASPLENFADFFEYETGEKFTREYHEIMEDFLRELRASTTSD